MVNNTKNTTVLPADIKKQLRQMIETNAINAYKTRLSEGNFEAAAYIAKEHELTAEQMKAAAVKAYETCVSKGKLDDAEKIAKEHELTKKQMKAAAVSAYEKCLYEGYFEHAADIAEYYELGKDIVDGTNKLLDLLRIN